MDNNVATVMGELRQDHRNMALMLNLLEAESNKLFEGEEADFDLIHDIMHYMTIYPDAVHHPKEDRIYAELKTVRPDLTVGFDRITVDHRSIAEQGMKLKQEVEAVIAGSFVRKNAVVADALRYVNTLRGHMQWEELDLFRRVDEMVREGHELLEAATYLQGSDPVFGPEVEKDFGRLFESVEARIKEDG